MRQRRIQVEFFQAAAPVRHFTQSQLRQVGQQFGGFAATMGFYHADQHLPTGFALALGGTQHGVGFADPSAGPKVNAQLAPAGFGLLCVQALQQFVRVWALRACHRAQLTS